jgi:hypothetical protein
MTFEEKSGIVRITFKISSMPHPDQRHLGSRLFPIGRIMEYTDNHITVLTRKPTELLDQVSQYLRDRNVKLSEYTEEKY